VAGLDGLEQGAVGGVEFLIAAAAIAGVVNHVRRLALEIRVARVDAAEVGEQGYDAPIPMIDPIARLVHLGNLGPGQNVSRF